MAGLLALGAGGGFGGALSLIGTAVSAVGTIAAGAAQAQAAEYQAKQYEIKAKEERAAAQMEGFQYAQQKRLAQSRTQAVAAASGFSASDPGTLDVIGDIERYGTWQEQVARYGGDSRAQGLIDTAAGIRSSASANMFGSVISAGSTIIGGVGSFFSKYGGGYTGYSVAPTTLRYGAVPDYGVGYGQGPYAGRGYG